MLVCRLKMTKFGTYQLQQKRFFFFWKQYVSPNYRAAELCSNYTVSLNQAKQFLSLHAPKDRFGNKQWSIQK